ncbi:hypothetical protein [Bradyrhizobium genosp. A]|uniref:hypothetical protein n=1 Tax=Bradyrhizobium genosp. A TaxID=83626 RepID=UPI003CE9223E
MDVKTKSKATRSSEAPGKSAAASTAVDEPKRPMQPKRRPQIDSTLYFIERDGDEIPLSHFDKFDIT